MLTLARLDRLVVIVAFGLFRKGRAFFMNPPKKQDTARNESASSNLIYGTDHTLRNENTTKMGPAPVACRGG